MCFNHVQRHNILKSTGFGKMYLREPYIIYIFVRRVFKVFKNGLKNLTQTQKEVFKPKLMNKSVISTLQLAVQQLFVRLHLELVEKVISNSSMNKEPVDVEFDAKKEDHLKLVKLYKEKMGYKPVATNRDIFYSIMLTYQNVHYPKNKIS